MKLVIIALVLSSLAVMKVNAKAADNNEVCTDQDGCTDSEAECRSVPDGSALHCLCKPTKQENADGDCKNVGGTNCTMDAQDECASDECNNATLTCEGKNLNGVACLADEECKSMNCHQKKCAAGASAIAVSMVVMLLGLVTSRFL